MRQTSEPSVEEILESIKKVIARDSRDDAPEDRVRVRKSSDQADHTVKVQDIALDDDVLDLADADAVEGDDAAAEEPLVTESASTSMRESLAVLAMLAEPGVAPQIVRSGETSLEGMVRDLLRPALADWLDKNLPPMVERMVATEIARIAGKRG